MPSPHAIRRDLDAIAAGLARCSELLDSEETSLHERVVKVSNWSPCEHLQHMALVLHHNLRGIAVIQRQDQERMVEGPRPGVGARAILLLGRIPRGRASAPDPVLPDERPNAADLARALEDLLAPLPALRRDAEVFAALEGRVAHPVLGAFTAAQWVRFARVHLDHHLSIIQDIRLRQEKVGSN